MMVAESVGGFGVSNAEVVVVVDDEAIVPKQPKHLKETQITTQETTNAMVNKMGQVAEGYGGYADDMVEGLGKLAKFSKI